MLFLKDKTPIPCKVRKTFCSEAKALKRSRRVSLMQPSTTSRLKGVSCDTAAKFSCTTGKCVAAKDTHKHPYCSFVNLSETLFLIHPTKRFKSKSAWQGSEYGYCIFPKYQTIPLSPTTGPDVINRKKP